MRIFLAGVSCVGKTTVGARLADLLGCRFFDLDEEIARFFATPLDRLRRRYLTQHAFSLAGAQALAQLLARADSSDCVIALSPGGLMGGYWKIVGKTPDATIVVLADTPENILARVTFYDADSRPLQVTLTAREKRHHLREIRRDIAYYGRSFQRAHATVDIAGCDPDAAARKVGDALAPVRLALARPTEPGTASERPAGSPCPEIER